ncbi:MAG: YtxH domain-containing protein [bacterium]|nr:YtxH domain-containing protein [bacterium]
MSRRQERQHELDSGLLVWGMLYGLIIGGVTALLTLPKSGLALRRSLESRMVLVRPADPVADSIAQGKLAAQRRRELQHTP